MLNAANRFRLAVWRMALVAFVIRALVPVGFMPSYAALNDGRFELAICSAAIGAVSADATKSPLVPAAPKSPQPSDCVFGTVASQTLVLQMAGALAAPAFVVAANWAPPPAPVPASAVAWKSLGSRAPPANLA
jgi:hypothetical protein